jgi:hypothetical protein
MLHHPAGKDPSCAPIDQAPERVAGEVGYFYAPNIVEQWIRPAGDGVDIILERVDVGTVSRDPAENAHQS